jgi:hypothetical protein
MTPDIERLSLLSSPGRFTIDGIAKSLVLGPAETGGMDSGSGISTRGGMIRFDEANKSAWLSPVNSGHCDIEILG